MNDFRTRFSLTLLVLMFSVFLFGAFGGYVSNFEIKINLKHRHATIAANRGYVSALHTQEDDQGNIISQWRINSYQLMFGSQWIRIFETRELVVGNLEDNNHVNVENLLNEKLFARFTKIDRVGDQVYLWENYTTPTVYVGKVHGITSLSEYINSL
ncbi:hypothetical protein KP803_11750 [Vibrio sp. ZSDE26]|uniref:Uncharacterized protein n=1 Tax=Vibrio amylolyticus TaxID=2847292 RepID=A0A9X2BHJ0_9VIBR|nr:hypothetical protein [Vibrio amylolyticus]MCK6263944.1 hypothetical protein [Vibrio amylolyticus]